MQKHTPPGRGGVVWCQTLLKYQIPGRGIVLIQSNKRYITSTFNLFLCLQVQSTLILLKFLTGVRCEIFQMSGNLKPDDDISYAPGDDDDDLSEDLSVDDKDSDPFLVNSQGTRPTAGLRNFSSRRNAPPASSVPAAASKRNPIARPSKALASAAKPGAASPGGKAGDHKISISDLRKLSNVRKVAKPQIDPTRMQFPTPSISEEGASRRRSKKSSDGETSFEGIEIELANLASVAENNVFAGDNVVQHITHKRFERGENVLVAFHVLDNDDGLGFEQQLTSRPVNKFGFPKGIGNSEEEREGPHIYVLAEVLEEKLDENSTYYLVKRYDTGNCQRADSGE